ncbi:MAG TPA: hypothetical protein VMD30_06535, partial [Tepidisphaeraceae bacterium]|nr:hypothetical protein [Tepidisphaeraceae bacterium]
MCAASITVVFLGVLPIASKFDLGSSDQTVEVLWSGLAGITGISLAVAIYLYVSRVLVSRLDIRDERSTSEQINSVRRWLGLLAHLWWTAGVSLALELVPKDHGYNYVPKEPW